MRRFAKLSVASLAFVPCVVLILLAAGVIPRSLVTDAALVVYFPALSLWAAAATFHFPAHVNAVIAVVCFLGWAVVLATLLWKIAATFVGEDERDDGSFDWEGFWVRFACGAILGALIGWRVWIRAYQHVGLVTCMAVGAVVIGFCVGIAWRDDFWKRPI